MNVIGHKTIGMKLSALALDSLIQNLVVITKIVLCEKTGTSVMAPLDQMCGNAE